MRKIVLILALTAAIVFSVGAPVWAASPGYSISGMTAAYQTIYSTDVKIGYLANIVISTTLEKYSDAGDYTQSADKITWTVSNNDGALIRCKLVSADKDTAEVSEAEVSGLTAGVPQRKPTGSGCGGISLRRERSESRQHWRVMNSRKALKAAQKSLLMWSSAQSPETRTAASTLPTQQAQTRTSRTFRTPA